MVSPSESVARAATVMVPETVAPAAGEVISATGGLAFPPATVQVSGMLWLKVPLAPTIMRAYVPAAAVPGSSVSLDDAPAATGLALKLAVAPAGSPLAASAMFPAKAPTGATATV